MTPSDAAATALLNATKNKDLSQALSGEPIRGRDHVSRFLNVYLPVINDVHLVRQISEGDCVATVWHAETSFGPISLVYICRIEIGKIVEIEAFYDPRAFLERMGMWTGMQDHLDNPHLPKTKPTEKKTE